MYWHGENCDVFCQPHDNDEGHYDCDLSTGDKLCHPGIHVFKFCNCNKKGLEASEQLGP